MECVVDAAERLTDCRIAAETPPGMGFGQGVLKISGLFRMRGTDADGVPTAGRSVRIPMRLSLPANVQTSLIKLPSARWAGRTADVDCRVRGSSIDNCQVFRVEPYDSELSQIVGDLPPKLNRWVAGDIQGRVKFRFQFVEPPKQ